MDSKISITFIFLSHRSFPTSPSSEWPSLYELAILCFIEKENQSFGCWFEIADKARNRFEALDNIFLNDPGWSEANFEMYGIILVEFLVFRGIDTIHKRQNSSTELSRKKYCVVANGSDLDGFRDAAVDLKEESQQRQKES